MEAKHTTVALRGPMTLERETPVSALGFSPDHQATEIMRDGYSLGYWIDSDWSGHGPIARLISAAPDMLDTLETCRVALNNPESDHYRKAALAEVLAVIAKATGGAA